MGEAKRRKKLDPMWGQPKALLLDFDPLEEMEFEIQYGAIVADDWPKVSKNDLVRAREVVPRELAYSFYAALDGDQIQIDREIATFPDGWSWESRCVEFYRPAMEWVRLRQSQGEKLSDSCRSLELAVMDIQAFFELGEVA